MRTIPNRILTVAAMLILLSAAGASAPVHAQQAGSQPGRQSGDSFAATQTRFFPSAIQGVDVELSRFGSFVAFSDRTEGNSVRVLDGSGELLWRHRQPVYWGGTFRRPGLLRFAPDESYLLVPAYRTDSDIALVDPRTGEALSVLTDHSDTVTQIALSRDGTYLVTCTYNEVFLWKRDADSFRVVHRLESDTTGIRYIAFAPDGGLVAMGRTDDTARQVNLYRIRDDRLEAMQRFELEERNLSREFEQIAFSPDGSRLAAGYTDAVMIWRRSSEQRYEPAAGIEAIDLGAVNSVGFSPDGGLLLTGHHRHVRAWRQDGGTWREEATITPHHGPVRDMEFSPDGTVLAIAGLGDTNGLGLWSVSGVGADPVGIVFSLLGGRISAAQKSLLGDALAMRILSGIDPEAAAPRDMFETDAEYAGRRGGAARKAAELLQEETERYFRAVRFPAAGAMYEVAVPLQSQGSYAIDTKTYSFRFMDTTATVTLDRDPARDLYRSWQKAEVRASRIRTPDGTTYADFRLVHPTRETQTPVGLAENPFTGERLDRYGISVPSIAVGSDLLLQDLSIEGVFPSLFRSYAQNSLGRVTLRNTGSAVLTDLSAQFFVPGLMQVPSDLGVPAVLGVGQSIELGIRALFDAAVLGRTEGGSAAAELTVEYSSRENAYREVISRPIGILNRNAIRWTDDRKVGAFMGVNEPALLRWSGQVAGMTDDATPTGALPRNFLSAVRLFEALGAAGLKYVVDPSSAYEALSREEGAIDYLRFPLETLDGKAGDCDDLSVLYATLLESVGVPAAFITTPGHIYTAFDSGLAPELASRILPSIDDLIVRDGTVWFPVETTLVDQGFTKAWQTGARQWRDAASRDAAAFFTVREAWESYAPAGFPGASSAPLPPQDRLSLRYRSELDAYRTIVLAPQESELLERLEGAPSSAGENRLGILYATVRSLYPGARALRAGPRHGCTSSRHDQRGQRSEPAGRACGSPGLSRAGTRAGSGERPRPSGNRVFLRRVGESRRRLAAPTSGRSASILRSHPGIPCPGAVPEAHRRPAEPGPPPPGRRAPPRSCSADPGRVRNDADPDAERRMKRERRRNRNGERERSTSGLLSPKAYCMGYIFMLLCRQHSARSPL